MYRGKTKAESIETKDQNVYFNLLFFREATPYNSASGRSSFNFFFFSIPLYFNALAKEKQKKKKKWNIGAYRFVIIIIIIATVAEKARGRQRGMDIHLVVSTTKRNSLINIRKDSFMHRIEKNRVRPLRKQNMLQYCEATEAEA